MCVMELFKEHVGVIEDVCQIDLRTVEELPTQWGYPMEYEL